MVSTFRLTILFVEFFGQSNGRISPASHEFYFESRSSFLDSRDEINPYGDQNNFFAANFHDNRPENRPVEIGLMSLHFAAYGDGNGVPHQDI